MTVVSGEYVTFKHLKTRKVVVLEIEIPEENFEDVVHKLGIPISGRSKPVAVALLNDDVEPAFGPALDMPDAPMFIPQFSMANKNEKKKREWGDLPYSNRAGILCNESKFQVYLMQRNPSGDKPTDAKWAADCIRTYCRIKSRKELDTPGEAQEKFKILSDAFDAWTLQGIYADNLDF